MESTMKKRDQYGEFLDSLSILGIEYLLFAIDNIQDILKMNWINGSA